MDELETRVKELEGKKQVLTDKVTWFHANYLLFLENRIRG